MATISNTPRPGYVWDSTDNVWYPIGTGPHTHADYITSGSAINPNIVDAKGDIIAATAADTVARLAVGANDTVLTADSSTATGLKWATPSSGSMTLLSTTTLSGSTTTISSISSSYTHLQIIGRNAYSSSGVGCLVRLNGNTTNGDYKRMTFENVSNTVSASTTNDSSVIQTGTDSTWNDGTFFVIDIPRYSQTENRMISVQTVTRGARQFFSNLLFTSTSAISSIGFELTGGATWSGGTVYVYGVN